MYKNGLYVGYIYKITNKINGKMYIGQTAETIHRRFKRHGYDCKKSNAHFPRAIRKYGIDNFEVEELEKISCETKEQLYILLQESETRLIEKYNTFKNGYNSTLGGEGCLGIKMSDSRKQSIRESMESNLQKIRIPILQYDLNGNLIKRHKSILDASNYSGYGRSIIKQCCENKKVYKKEFLFKYDDETDLNLYDYKIGVHHSSKRIAMYTLNGKFVKEYNSIIDASRENNINHIAIIRNCKGDFKRAGKYQFRYIDEFGEFPKRVIKFNPWVSKHQSPIAMYDKEGNLIEVYSMIKEASSILGFYSSEISDVCRNKKQYIHGFRFRYLTEEERKNKKAKEKWIDCTFV
jgi:predicted GIY-YIG superfamily endonuclease